MKPFILQKLLAFFEIESLVLRRVNFGEKMTEAGIVWEVSEIIERPTEPSGAIFGRTMQVGKSTENKNAIKALISLVEFERSMITSCVANISNFKNYGMFDKDKVEAGTVEFNITSELDSFINGLATSIQFIQNRFMTQENEPKNIFTMKMQYVNPLGEGYKEVKNTSHERMVRTVHYSTYGERDFDLKDEMVALVTDDLVYELVLTIGFQDRLDGPTMNLVKAGLNLDIKHRLQSVGGVEVLDYPIAGSIEPKNNITSNIEDVMDRANYSSLFRGFDDGGMVTVTNQEFTNEATTLTIPVKTYNATSMINSRLVCASVTSNGFPRQVEGLHVQASATYADEQNGVGNLSVEVSISRYSSEPGDIIQVVMETNFSSNGPTRSLYLEIPVNGVTEEPVVEPEPSKPSPEVPVENEGSPSVTPITKEVKKEEVSK